MKGMFLSLICLFTFACSTSSRFVIPAGTTLEINDQNVTPDAQGNVEMRPFFWTEVKGVDYKLRKDSKVVKEGKLKTRFRVASIFWPPFAVAYWPLGFKLPMYDLTQEQPAGVK